MPTDTAQLQATIDLAWDNRAQITAASAPDVLQAVESVIVELDAGRLRVAEKIDGEWVTHQWLKKAVLLYFRLHDNKLMKSGELQFFDKVPLKFAQLSEAQIRETGVRVVP